MTLHFLFELEAQPVLMNFDLLTIKRQNFKTAIIVEELKIILLDYYNYIMLWSKCWMKLYIL